MADEPKPIQLSRKQLEETTARIKTQIDAAEGDRKPYLDDVSTNRDLLKPRQERDDKPWDDACELHVPLCKYMRNALLARVYRALLGPSPIFNVESEGSSAFPEERDYAPQVERMLDLQVRQPRMEFKQSIRRILQASFDDGVGVAYLDWVVNRRKRPIWTMAQNEEGLVQWKRETPEIVYYEGPRVFYAPIETVGTFPAQMGHFQESLGVYYRFPTNGDELLLRAHEGDYDQEQVNKLLEWAGDENVYDNVDDEMRGVNNTSEMGLTRHSRPYQMTEAHWRLALKENEPAQDWLITMHEPTGIAVRAFPAPFAHGYRPLVAFRPFPDKFGIIGDSVVDLLGDLQIAMTTLLRLIVDGTALAIAPEMLVEAAMTPQDIENFAKHRGPAGIISVHPGTADKVKPFLSSVVQPTVGLPTMELIRQISERAIGISDTNLGKAAPQHMTATQVEELLQEGGENLAMTVEQESQALSDLGEMLLALDAESADSPTIQELWRRANGPSTPEELAETGGLVALRELSGAYSVMASGTLDASNRAVQAKKAAEILASVAQDPLSTPSQIYAAKLGWFAANGIRNPEKYIGTEQEFVAQFQSVQQRIQQQQQAAELSGAGPMAPGPQGPGLAIGQD